MTQEDIACIIRWFAHIEQLATDRKNANGFVMKDVGHLLNTIKVVAKDSREYVEQFCQPSLPSDLDEAVEGEVCILPGGVAYVKEKNNDSLKQYILDNFKAGDKVKIIIVKEENK